jgi:hypothetical protein
LNLSDECGASLRSLEGLNDAQSETVLEMKPIFLAAEPIARPGLATLRLDRLIDFNDLPQDERA